MKLIFLLVIPNANNKAMLHGIFAMLGTSKIITIDMEYYGATIDAFCNKRVGVSGSIVRITEWYSIQHLTKADGSLMI